MLRLPLFAISALSLVILMSLARPASPASLTIIGASSTLGLLVLPRLPETYTDLTLITGPSEANWPKVCTALPPRFKPGGTHCKRVKLVCYDPDFVNRPLTPSDTVLFITPPSAFPSYPDAVSHAISMSRNCVLISSAGVYGSAEGVVTCDTTLCPPSDMSERQLRINSGEVPVLSHRAGVVMRLSGLWTPNRGPHRYWMSSGEVKGDPEGGINLVHYEDVAEAVKVVLWNLGGRGSVEEGERVCLVSDGAEMPCSRRKVCEVASKVRCFHCVPLTGTPGIISNSLLRDLTAASVEPAIPW